MDLRLAVPAAACWLAAGVMIAFCDVAFIVALALWLVTIVTITCLLALRRTRVANPLQLVGVAVTGCALVVTVIAVTAPSRYPQDVVSQVSGGRAIVATVLVTSAAQSSSPQERYSFRGTATSISIGRDIHHVDTPVLIFATDREGGGKEAANAQTGYFPGAGGVAQDVAAVAPDIRIGSQMTIRGTARSLLSEDNIALMIFARGAPVLESQPPPWLEWANGLRAGFARAALTLPGDGGGLLPGLAIGDTSAVSAQLDAAMKSSSLSHLTAVSGANCVIVVAAMMLLGAALGLPRGIRIALAIVALAGFVVLVTPEGSVLRASVMAVVVMISLGTGRTAHGLPALSFAVVILLTSDPWLARNYGFALSVLATAGLLTLARPIGASLGRWMPQWMGTLVAIPLAAQLACQPVLVLLDPSLSLFGVPANLLAAPAAPVATMVGLVGCLLLPLAAGLGQACLQIAWIPSWWIATVAQVTSGFPAARLPWMAGVAGLVWISVTTALALYLLLRRRSAPRTVMSMASLVGLLMVCGGYTGAVLGNHVARQWSVPQDWHIAACDVGQGDAVIVRSGSVHALVDVGPDPELLTACLTRLGVDQIDLLVLTHYDFDHVGGVAAVLGRVGLAIVGPPDGLAAERLLASLRAGGATLARGESGMSGNLGDARWRVLWPEPERHATRFVMGNPGSVTIEFDGGNGGSAGGGDQRARGGERRDGIRSVFLGDLGEEAQKALLATHRVDPVDVVKVAHHGSADQSGELYQRLHAAVGLISVGSGNMYGHPSKRLLSVLNRAGTHPQRTDTQGMVVISPPATGEGALRVWSERRDEGAE